MGAGCQRSARIAQALNEGFGTAGADVELDASFAARFGRLSMCFLASGEAAEAEACLAVAKRVFAHCAHVECSWVAHVQRMLDSFAEKLGEMEDDGSDGGVAGVAGSTSAAAEGAAGDAADAAVAAVAQASIAAAVSVTIAP